MQLIAMGRWSKSMGRWSMVVPMRRKLKEAAAAKQPKQSGTREPSPKGDR